MATGLAEPMLAPGETGMILGLHPGERALVIAAHPGDETAGMGGTIAAMAIYGVTVDVLAVALAASVMPDGPASTQVRLAEFTDACDVLGVHDRKVEWIDGDRARNPAVYLPDLAALIEHGAGPSLETSRPAAVFVPARGHHPDRQAVCQAALMAVYPGWSRKQFLPRLILGYDSPEDRVWVTADGARPVLVDITATAAVKGEALGCYLTHVQEDLDLCSLAKIQAMDQAAGAALATQAAEGFAVYRMTF